MIGAVLYFWLSEQDKETDLELIVEAIEHWARLLELLDELESRNVDITQLIIGERVI